MPLFGPDGLLLVASESFRAGSTERGGGGISRMTGGFSVALGLSDGIGDSLPLLKSGSVGESAETSGFLGRKGGGMWRIVTCVDSACTMSENFLASSSVGGGLDRELAVLSSNPIDP